MVVCIYHASIIKEEVIKLRYIYHESIIKEDVINVRCVYIMRSS